VPRTIGSLAVTKPTWMIGSVREPVDACNRAGASRDSPRGLLTCHAWPEAAGPGISGAMSVDDTQEPRGPGGGVDVFDPAHGLVIAGKYEVVRYLGSGGMGTVYEARHRETGGRVALKLMSTLDDPARTRRFRLEAELAASLSHSNTIRVMDFGDDAGRLFLAMEFVDGESLQELVAREGALPWRRAAHIVRQVLKALWEAHEHPRRIVHRDIKPANIMLSDQPGAPDHVRVVDFGIARALEESGAGTQGCVGTPVYIAPELWDGRPADARSDLYAVGCVMYELLSGDPPFLPDSDTSPSLFALIDMHRATPPPPLLERAVDVPAPLAAWVETLLAKDPAARPPSASGALAALDEALASVETEPTLASAESAGSTAPEESPPAGAPSPAASAREVPALGEVVGTRTNTPAQPAPSRVAQSSRRVANRAARRALPLVLTLAVAGAVAGAVFVFAMFVFGGDDGTTRATRVEAAPPVVSAYGDFLFSYRARLSAADHHSATGIRLRRASEVLARDRARYHAGFGDPEDGHDDFLATADAQAKLEALLELTLEPAISEAIRHGTPFVEVAIHERGVIVRVLD